MTPFEIIETAKSEGVLIYLSDTGNIKASGEQGAVERWRDILRENKAGIIGLLTGQVMAVSADLAPPLPSWCRIGCPSLDVISGVGPGCIRSLADGPWREEWRRLNTMATCPKRMH